MDGEFDSDTLAGSKAIEEQTLAQFRSLFEPKEYRQVFCTPPADEYHPFPLFPSGYSFLEGYFESAKRLLEGIVAGHVHESIEGAVAIFLSRHYLELAIKYTLFHSRWLKSESENARAIEIERVKRTHDLHDLWETLDDELARKASLVPTGLDLDFVRELVKEFHLIDQRNWRFRYQSEQLPEQCSEPDALRIDFASLLFDLQRACEVLKVLDNCLLQAFGENQEWEAERQSW